MTRQKSELLLLWDERSVEQMLEDNLLSQPQSPMTDLYPLRVGRGEASGHILVSNCHTNVAQ